MEKIYFEKCLSNVLNSIPFFSWNICNMGVKGQGPLGGSGLPAAIGCKNNDP